MKEAFDLVVVGGGIVGAACAWACAREGMRVAIVEDGMIGGRATAAGMGHITVMDDSEAQFALTRYSQLLWNDLAKDLPGYVEYERRGTLWIAAGAGEMDLAQSKLQRYRAGHVAAELLQGNALAAAEPGLRSGLEGALKVSGDAVIYAPGAARYLLEEALRHQAVVFRERVVALASGRAVLQGGTELHAPRLINAAGDRAAQLNPELAIRLRKGHLAITGRYPGRLRHQLVELGYLAKAHSSTLDSVAFNVQPRATGQILIGSSRQYGSERDEVESGILAQMLRHASQFMPSLGSCSILRTWTGFRAATPDMLPFIGPSRNDPSVYLAAGHEGLGITMSLGTAQLLCDGFAGRTPAIPHEPYLPSRNIEAPHD